MKLYEAKNIITEIFKTFNIVSIFIIKNLLALQNEKDF